MSIRNAARRSHVNDVPRSQFAVAVNHRWNLNFRVADHMFGILDPGLWTPHTCRHYDPLDHSRLLRRFVMTTRTILFAFAVAAVLHCGRSGVLAQSLYTLPEGVDTRWASAENPLGEKGNAAQTNGGRKGRPAIPVKAGEQVTLAEVRGSSGTVRRIWATISDRSPAMLRGLKI